MSKQQTSTVAHTEIEEILKELHDLEQLHAGLAEGHERENREVERAYNVGKLQAYQIAQNKLKGL